MNEHNDKFKFTYTAPNEDERREINSIRKSYLTPTKEESKLGRLRKLDSHVKNTPTCIALVLGICGCMIFGLGMTMSLEWNEIVLGVIVSAIGAIPMLLAYPVFKIVLKKMKAKYSNEILTLSDEILNEHQKNA